MKRARLLLTSIVAAMTMGVAAQTDVTNMYLTNADFADGTFVNNAPKGWTLELTSSGVQSKISMQRSRAA